MDPSYFGHNYLFLRWTCIPNGAGIERAAEYCFNVAQDMIKEQYGDRCWVEKVEVFEHENNSAIYTNPELQIL